MGMVYVATDGDGIGNLVGRASLNNDEASLSRLSQALEQANQMVGSWAINSMGAVIGIGGDEARLKVPGDKLAELSTVRAQYLQITGATLSVGVGMSLHQADSALLWSKLNGKNRVSFYTPDMETELEAARLSIEGQSEEQKIATEYLAKTNTGSPGVFRGDTSTGMTHPKGATQPTAPGSKPKAEPAPHVPKPTADQASQNFERHFRHLAHGQAQKEDEAKAQASQPTSDDVIAGVVDILKQVKAAAPTLDALKEAAPDAYEAVMGAVKSMIEMAKLLAPEATMQKSEALSCPKCKFTKVIGAQRVFCTSCKHAGDRKDFEQAGAL